jgi:acylphosphatase
MGAMTKAGGGMPVPATHQAARDDVMPRPSSDASATGMAQQVMQAIGASAAPPPAGAGAGGAMPQPGNMHSGSGEGGIPRFPTPDSGRSGPQYEQGVVEVQFREGVAPNVMSPSSAKAPAIGSRSASSPAAASLDQVNQLLQRYKAVSAEPTFTGTVEEGDRARSTASAQGIDVPHLNDFVTLHFPPDANVAEIAEQLSALDEVERAVPVPVARPPQDVEAPPRPALRPAGNRDTSGDEQPPTGAPLNEPLVGAGGVVTLNPATGRENQWYIFRCGINQAWSGAAGANVVVADVDWGFRTTHEDLAGRIVKTYNAVDGTANVTNGGSVFHGTGVLGLAGAAVNGKGMAGIAYEAQLWGIQGDSGTGTPLGGNAWARGIDWVRTTDSGGRRKVIILEVQTGAFGNYEQVPSVNAAIKTAIAAGVVVCVAAGNGDRDAGLDDAGNPFPATGSILVGATSYDAATNPRAWFSNFGPTVVVAAPGDSAHDLTCDSSSNTAYRNGFGGTSGATPKVAGVVALLLGANPSLTHAQIRGILNSTGTAVTTAAGKPVGSFMNAAAAMSAATGGAVGRMEVFARGTDKAVWHMWQTAPSNGWSGWASMGGWVDIIKTGRNADGRLELFARGSDAALWHIWQNSAGGSLSGWQSLGGWIDLIEVGRNQDGRLEVFARGSDGAVWHKWQTAPNNGWSGWASLGGWIDRLKVASKQDGRIEIFARGTEGALWHNWQTAPNSGWSGWASLGGWIDRVEVGRNADCRLEMFARGSDGALWHKWQTAPNSGWSGWASLGGWIDQITVGSNADGRLEVFARGSDKAVWHMWQTAPNNGWSGWASQGGWVDRLAVSRNADGRLELFARGSDAALWHLWQVAPNSGWSGWASLGGVIDSIEVAQNVS